MQVYCHPGAQCIESLRTAAAQGMAGTPSSGLVADEAVGACPLAILVTPDRAVLAALHERTRLFEHCDRREEHASIMVTNVCNPCDVPRRRDRFMQQVSL